MSNKLGICYNVFQGTELLPYAIEEIRHHVDVVVACVQSHSWTKQPIKQKDVLIVAELKNKGLIDDVIYFTPTAMNPKVEQTNKSEFCRRHLKEVHNCTHFIISDVDEIYQREQFAHAKEVMLKGEFKSSACLMETYYKDPIYKLSPRVDFYVPFIFQMDYRDYSLNATFPVKVDPSRKINSGIEDTVLFSPDQLLMHHYSYIRSNLEEKVFNSSNYPKHKTTFEGLAEYWNKWEFPMPAIIGLNQTYNVERVDNQFNIQV